MDPPADAVVLAVGADGDAARIDTIKRAGTASMISAGALGLALASAISCSSLEMRTAT